MQQVQLQSVMLEFFAIYFGTHEENDGAIMLNLKRQTEDAFVSPACYRSGFVSFQSAAVCVKTLIPLDNSLCSCRRNHNATLRVCV